MGLGRRERKECAFLGSLILGPAITMVLGTWWTLIPCLLDGWASAKLESLKHVYRPKGKSDTRAEEGGMCAERLGIGEKVPIDSRLG